MPDGVVELEAATRPRNKPRCVQEAAEQDALEGFVGACINDVLPRERRRRPAHRQEANHVQGQHIQR